MSLNAGIISKEGLTEVFRKLWKQKRHGRLALKTDGRTLTIVCEKGSIVGAESDEAKLEQMIVDRLEASGVIDPSLAGELRDSCQTLEELYAQLVGKEHISRDEFVRARSVSEHDILYSLRHIEDGLYRFEMEVSGSDDLAAINIQPSQLLLELAELEEAQDELNTKVEHKATQTVVVPESEALDEDLSAFELEMMDLVGGEASIADLRKAVLLTEYEFRQTMRTLQQRGAIRLVDLEEFRQLQQVTQEPAPNESPNESPDERTEEPETVPEPETELQQEKSEEFGNSHFAYFFGRDEVLQVSSLIVTLVFLFAIGVFAPNLFTRFFADLELLTSLI